MSIREPTNATFSEAMPSDLQDLIVELDDRQNVEDEAEGEQRTAPVYNISSYGADFSAEQHAKRMLRNVYVIPVFQRSYIWSSVKASKFIESLLLGLPVPSVFLYKEPKSEKYLVVDGQQRLKTLRFFYQGIFEEGPARDRAFRLVGVDQRWDDRTYRDLAENDRQRLDDAIIHAIIFRQEEPGDDASSIFHVFERLNTGGMNLSPQEIRTCVAHGDFSKLLRQLNDDVNWRAIFGKKSIRLKDEELILRFLALYQNYQAYSRPMIDFLTNFMTRYRNDDGALARFGECFRKTIACARDCLGDQAFRPEKSLNAALYDACMVGLARRLDKGGAPNPECVKEAYHKLVVDGHFQKLYRKATADRDSVMQRIEQAISAFSSC